MELAYMKRTGVKVFSLSWYLVVVVAVALSFFGFESLAQLLVFVWLAMVFSWMLVVLFARRREFFNSVELNLTDFALGLSAFSGFLSITATRTDTPALFRASLRSAMVIFSFMVLVWLFSKFAIGENFVLGTARSFASVGFALLAFSLVQRVIHFELASKNQMNLGRSFSVGLDRNSMMFFAGLLPLFFLLALSDGRNAKRLTRLALVVFWLTGALLTFIYVFSFGALAARTLLVVSTVFSVVIVLVALKFRTRLSEATEQNDGANRRLRRRYVLLVSSLIFLTIFFVVLNWSPESPVLGSFVSKFQKWLGELQLTWRASFDAWRRASFGGFFGRGAGTLSFHLPFAMAEAIERHPEKLTSWTDNVRGYAPRVLPELGVPGVVGFSLLVLLLLARWIRSFGISRDEPNGARKLISFMSLASVGAVLGVALLFNCTTLVTSHALLLLFVLGVTFSDHFGPSKPLLRTPLCPLKATFFSSLALSALVVVVVLLWVTVGNYGALTLSDFHFERGLGAFTELSVVRQQLYDVDSELSRIDQRRAALEHFEGEYMMLHSDNWHRFAKAQAERFGNVYDFEKSEKERLAKIDEEKRKLDERKTTLLKEKTTLEARIPPLYSKATSEFLRSVRLLKERGEAYFYLGGLALDQTRLEHLRKLAEPDLKAYFEGKLDDLQKVTPAYLREDLKVILGNVEPNLEGEVRESFIKLQMLLDSIALYQASTVHQTSRDAYLSLATRYSAAYSIMDSLVEAVRDDSVRRSLLVTMSRFFNRYIGVALRTTYVWPATWHKFPAHKPFDVEVSASGGDAYRLLAGLAIEVRNPLNEDCRNLVFSLAEREVWACVNMENAGLWGVPDGVFDFVLATAFEHGSASEPAEAIVTLDQLLQLYSEPYSICLRKLSEKRKLEETFSRKLEILTNQLASILEKDDKGYLGKTIGEIFDSQFSSVRRSFLNGNFRTHIESYYRELFSRSLRVWRNVPKKSLWKSMVAKASDNFRYQLEPLYLSEAAQREVDLILDSISTDPEMLRFERYGLFVAGYEFARETIVVNAKKLLEAYANVPKEKIVEAWQGVAFDDEIVRDADQVIEYLNEVVKRYGG